MMKKTKFEKYLFDQLINKYIKHYEGRKMLNLLKFLTYIKSLHVHD